MKISACLILHRACSNTSVVLKEQFLLLYHVKQIFVIGWICFKETQSLTQALALSLLSFPTIFKTNSYKNEGEKNAGFSNLLSLLFYSFWDFCWSRNFVSIGLKEIVFLVLKLLFLASSFYSFEILNFHLCLETFEKTKNITMKPLPYNVSLVS